MIKKIGIVGVLLGTIVLMVGMRFYQFLVYPLPLPADGYTFLIPIGTSIRDISSHLHQKKLLPYPNEFLIWTYAKGLQNRLKAGEYHIANGTTAKELILQLVSGKVVQHSFKIVPGWTFEQIMQEVNKHPKLTHTLANLNPSEIMTALDHQNEHPEGRFLPETYYFPLGTTDVDTLKRAYHSLDQQLNTLWQRRPQHYPLQSPYEALILASIIERESSLLNEYPEIAGVYIRRLQKKMPLQADPTIIYGLGSRLTGCLTREDLKQEDPYNTYLNLGLPPTPIAMPSIKALEAALMPKAGESLYFVARPNGEGHVFSNTLKEHLQAVRDYRNKR